MEHGKESKVWDGSGPDGIVTTLKRRVASRGQDAALPDISAEEWEALIAVWRDPPAGTS